MPDIFKRQKNIAAVSLIEIMMIFFIIAVVSVAGVSLNKPKQEYMRKIAVYSAYETLQNAVSKIVAEGHIDFFTDLGACLEVSSNSVGQDVESCKYPEYDKYPGMSNMLPKAVSRAAKKDDGTPADPNISKTAYSNATSALFLHLQDGFCQRLATAFQLDAHNINCPTDSSDNSHGSLIEDIEVVDKLYYKMKYPSSFSVNPNYTPSLYLPNGQVYYFGKDLLVNKNNNIIKVGITDKKSQAALGLAIGTWSISYVGSDAPENSQALLDEGFKAIFSLPYEAHSYLTQDRNNPSMSSLYLYFANFALRSKDYFNVYVDINGKMANAEDTASGPDRLNSDIFLFRVYRDGSVRPDYDSGFPKDLLLAKVLYKAPGATTFTSPASWGGKYASLPLVDAQCYANTSGTYSTHTISAFSQYVDYANLCPSIQPISDCIGKNGGTNCRVFINKPSFFVKN